MEQGNSASLAVMRTIDDYPPGLIGTIAALFGRSIAASHGVNWTLDAMIAEQHCEFFRRFDPKRDRVWVAMDQGIPRGGLTIEGPRPDAGRESARLRFLSSMRGSAAGAWGVRCSQKLCATVENSSMGVCTSLLCRGSTLRCGSTVNRAFRSCPRALVLFTEADGRSRRGSGEHSNEEQFLAGNVSPFPLPTLRLTHSTDSKNIAAQLSFFFQNEH
jgi:hypothetical protein